MILLEGSYLRDARRRCFTHLRSVVIHARLLVETQIVNFPFALNSATEFLNADTCVGINVTPARVTIHAIRGARELFFVAIFVEESATVLIRANHAVRNARYYVCIQNVLGNAAML
jgi:hypothetical protein